MGKLSEPQLALLQATAADPSGFTSQSSGAGAARTSAALIKAALMMSIPQDGGPSRLMITEKGRAVIGAPDRPSTPAKAPPPPPPAPAPKAAGGKIGLLIGLLSRESGATIDDMMAATGWQAHSVRGAMSGSIKKGLGLAVASDKSETGRIYRIVKEAA